jgi:hypothetical protein
VSRAWILNLSRLSLCVLLASCKAPVSFSSLETSASVSSSADETGTSSPAVAAVSDEDQEVIDSVCQRADADTRNGFEGDVFEKPFLNFAFPSAKELHVPKESCVKVEVLEETDVKRAVLYTYDCKDVSGTVQFSTEQRDSSFYSLADSNLAVKDAKGSRLIKGHNAHERFKAGSIIEDQEFEESFVKDTDEHVIAGVSTYDFSADEGEDQDGSVEIKPLSGFVQMDGNLTHTKNGETVSVRTVHSENLHRSECGFDEGTITIKSSERSITVTFTGCGKKTATAVAE